MSCNRHQFDLFFNLNGHPRLYYTTISLKNQIFPLKNSAGVLFMHASTLSPPKLKILTNCHELQLRFQAVKHLTNLIFIELKT